MMGNFKILAKALLFVDFTCKTNINQKASTIFAHIHVLVLRAVHFIAHVYYHAQTTELAGDIHIYLFSPSLIAVTWSQAPPELTKLETYARRKTVPTSCSSNLNCLRLIS